MRAGRLRARLQIQEATEVQDAAGEPIKTWSAISTNASVWAEVAGDESASGERFEGERERPEDHCTIRIRYRSDLDTRMRLVDGSVVYEILSLTDPDHRRRDLLVRVVARDQS